MICLPGTRGLDASSSTLPEPEHRPVRDSTVPWHVENGRSETAHITENLVTLLGQLRIRERTRARNPMWAL